MEENPRSKSAKLRVFENHKQKHNCTSEQRSFQVRGDKREKKRKSRGGNVMSVRRRQHVSASTYVDGNTVRKVQRTVEIRPERDEREEYRHKHAVRQPGKGALHEHDAYVLALTIAALITLVLCMNYLHKQASITTRINHIEDLELKLENLKSENDALQTRIDTYVDLDHVYKVATEELGMVYANKDQILLYDKTESEYVKTV